MLSVDVKPLIKRLNNFSTSQLEASAGLAINRNNYEISIEHWLMKVLENRECDISLILEANKIDLGQFRHALNQAIEEMPTGNSGRPSFSPLLFEIVQDAWLIASIQFGEAKIRTLSMLLAILNKVRYLSGEYTELLKKLSKDDIVKNAARLLENSFERSVVASDSGEVGGEGGDDGSPISSDESALKRFCEDITKKARDGKIDPVFGRDDEMRQMIDILARRRKNNPIITGEAGVGKTAVIEGLALKIAEGDVPKHLRDTSILSLDMALLEAGASVKGEFENRLRGVIEEVKASVKPIIIFIDEAHTLIGAGGSAGHDAANLLKPALARGELRTIAATTIQEYNKYFEKDPALTRRFQPINLVEPNNDITLLILRGLRDMYEQTHKVVIRDDALRTATELSTRYITGRYQPDKAVDLLDTCCARIRISISAKPDVIEDRERSIQALNREEKALARDRMNGIPIDEDRYGEIANELKTIEKELVDLNKRWDKEREAVDQLLDARTRLHEAQSAEKVDKKAVDKLIKEREKCQKAVDDARQDPPLVYFEVDPDAVAKVVSDWTGVPLGKVLRDEAQNLLALEENLKSRIKGQDSGIELVAEHLRTAKSGLKAPEQPLGIFLLVGPSGVGKTETALTVADTLFGGEECMVSINMSEFQEKHTISRLIGSPPGYVGYGEGGMLTEAVRHRPYTVVLLDEVEKSCLDVMNLFYQVFDKGSLTDGEGREVDFSNTVMFLTSNLATDEITAICEQYPEATTEQILEHVRPILSKWFKPALLARTTVVPYNILQPDALRSISALKLNKVAKLMKNQNGTVLSYTDAVLDQIAARCTEVETGARNIDHIIRGNVMPQLSQTIIVSMSTGDPADEIQIDVGKDGDFVYNIMKDGKVVNKASSTDSVTATKAAKTTKKKKASK